MNYGEKGKDREEGERARKGYLKEEYDSVPSSTQIAVGPPCCYLPFSLCAISAVVDVVWRANICFMTPVPGLGLPPFGFPIDQG